jgi:hypothetical protein
MVRQASGYGRARQLQPLGDRLLIDCGADWGGSLRVLDVALGLETETNSGRASASNGRKHCKFDGRFQVVKLLCTIIAILVGPFAIFLRDIPFEAGRLSDPQSSPEKLCTLLLTLMN